MGKPVPSGQEEENQTWWKPEGSNWKTLILKKSIPQTPLVGLDLSPGSKGQNCFILFFFKLLARALFCPWAFTLGINSHLSSLSSKFSICKIAIEKNHLTWF